MTCGGNEAFCNAGRNGNKLPGCFDEKLLREFIYFLRSKDQRKERWPSDTLYSFPSVK